MARALRSEIFQADTVGVYHCYNRIVRRSFLCGFDPQSRRDYSYRREWLHQRLKYLAQYFAVDVLGYAILSNHFHLVLRNRPDQVEAMTDQEVVRTWLMICPLSRRRSHGLGDEPTEAEIRFEENRGPDRVADLRNRLSSPSWIMRLVSQYMGTRCNAEDNARGHFWESRFGMQRLMDDAEVLACLAYVDLNPVRAGLVESLEGYEHVSIGERLRTLTDQSVRASDWLAPLKSPANQEVEDERKRSITGVERNGCQEARQDRKPCAQISLEDYTALLRWLMQRDLSLKRKDLDVPKSLERLVMGAQDFADMVGNLCTNLVSMPRSPRGDVRRGQGNRHRRRSGSPVPAASR